MMTYREQSEYMEFNYGKPFDLTVRREWKLDIG